MREMFGNRVIATTAAQDPELLRCKARRTAATALGLRAQTRPPGAEFLDAETGRQKSPPNYANASRSRRRALRPRASIEIKNRNFAFHDVVLSKNKRPLNCRLFQRCNPRDAGPNVSHGGRIRLRHALSPGDPRCDLNTLLEFGLDTFGDVTKDAAGTLL